jgi:hypothetical protein
LTANFTNLRTAVSVQIAKIIWNSLSTIVAITTGELQDDCCLENAQTKKRFFPRPNLEDSVAKRLRGRVDQL